MDIRELYKDLVIELSRLKEWDNSVDNFKTREREIQEILFEYIGDELTFAEAVEIGKSKVSVSFPAILEVTVFYTAAIKTIALMQAAKDWKEFDTLHKQKKKIKKQEVKKPTDFDKILMGIMKVPNKTKDK